MFIRHGMCRTYADISPKGDNGGMVKHTVVMCHDYVQLCSFWFVIAGNDELILLNGGDVSYNKYYIPAESVLKLAYSLWSIRGVWIVLRFKQ